MSTEPSTSSREEARRIAGKQIKGDKRSRLLVRWVPVVLAALIIAGVGYFISATNKPAGPTAGPANFSATGGIAFTKSDQVQAMPIVQVTPDTKSALAVKGEGKPKITMYVDFMCPGCGEFEKKFKQEIKDITDAGKATVEYHPVAFLDRMSQETHYSTRATNAVACLANKTPQKVLPFITTLFDHQPAENSTGLPDEKIIELAKQSTGEDLTSCVKEGTFKAWVKVVSDNATNSGLPGTPAIYINDQKWDGKGSLTEAIEKSNK